MHPNRVLRNVLSPKNGTSLILTKYLKHQVKRKKRTTPYPTITTGNVCPNTHRSVSIIQCQMLLEHLRKIAKNRKHRLSSPIQSETFDLGYSTTTKCSCHSFAGKHYGWPSGVSAWTVNLPNTLAWPDQCSPPIGRLRLTKISPLYLNNPFGVVVGADRYGAKCLHLKLTLVLEGCEGRQQLRRHS